MPCLIDPNIWRFSSKFESVYESVFETCMVITVQDFEAYQHCYLQGEVEA